MKTEKPDWMKRKELHDAEMIETGGHGRGGGPVVPRSHGAVYGTSESRVDQVGEGLIDVNHLMKRFEKIPTPEELAAAGYVASGGFYADFSTLPDYEQALQIKNAADAQFALLPAHLRARFENDQRQFLAFVHDPKNADEMIKMGLRNPPTEKPPEVTLKDINETLKANQGTKKNPSRRGEDEEG